MIKQINVFIGLLIISQLMYEHSTQNCFNDTSKDDFTNSHVGLIISPLKTKNMIREIEIYWYHPAHRSGDTIKLYKEQPRNNFILIFKYLPNVTNGIIKTGIEADFIPTANLTFTKQCLKYHVLWLRDNVVRKRNCLLTEPNWMAERRNILGNHSMRDIFLPGTHDSSAYKKEEQVGEVNFIDKYIITQNSDYIKGRFRILLTESVTFKRLIALQDEDILSQLIYGVRYLDIRVGYYPFKKITWWANHGFAPVAPLQTIIDDVKTFLNNTQEIVIFDVQEFPIGFGLDLDVHGKLVSYLKEQFSEYLVPKEFTWSDKLENLWKSGRRLIIGYDQNKVTAHYDSILPSVTQQWGNVQSPQDLYNYLNKIETAALSSSKTNPRSAMAELTPKAWDIILDRLNGLRQMAEDVNINITTWYNTLWHDSANIVTADFIRGTGIIEIAIEWNERRFSICNQSS